MKFLKLIIYIFSTFLLTLSLLYISACSDSEDDIFDRKTEFNIGITDIPCADIFTEVTVTFSSFVLKNVGTSEESDLLEGQDPVPVDILQYVSGDVLIIPFAGVVPGYYEMVSVTITSVVVDSDETVPNPLTPEEVTLLNDMLADYIGAGITFENFVGQFQVLEGMETTVIIDVNCDNLGLENGEFVPDMEIIDIVYQ